VSQFVLPDVLVLAAGGILGEAWMSGVLAGIEDGADVRFADVDHFVGTSAGSIVAAHLAAGRKLRRPARSRRAAGGSPGADPGFAADAARAGGGDATPRSSVLGRTVRGAGRAAGLATMPLVPAALALGAPAAARARGLVLSRLPDRGLELRDLRREIDTFGARFDGRLRVCAVDRATGRRVVFGRPGAPRASVADAVTASCSIPWVFRPVEIGGREYVDGGAWSLTNLDVAPAGRDSEVLCLNPSASLGVALSSLYGLARAAVGAAAEVEMLALRARGARVRMLGPSHVAGAHMGANFMNPRPAQAVLRAGYEQGLELTRG
jgi:NTE family protein